MLRREFEKLVAKVFEELPPPVLEHLDNVDIVIKWRPSPQEVRNLNLRGGSLFGLYQGTPLSHRGHYNLVLPDRIILYQETHERVASTPEALEAQIRKTLLHEIAHHLGIEEHDMRRLGLG